MNKNDRYYKMLLENYEEAAFKLFIYEHEMENVEKLKARSIPADIEKHAEEAYPSMIKMIRRNMNKQLLKGTFSKSLLKALRTASVLVLIIYIGFTIAVAGSSSVRRYVVEYLTVESDGHNTIGFYETGMTVEVPYEWNENYYLTYIPKGFSLEKVVCNETVCKVVYLNAEQDNIIFMVSGYGMSTDYNTEDCDTMSVKISGIDAQVSINDDGRVYMAWSKGDKYFLISSTLELEAIIQMAESVMTIK